MSCTKVKRSAAVLEYLEDWTDWLESGDTISSSTWSAQTGITVDSESETTTAATVWLSGGTHLNTYAVKNTITTAGGRTDTRKLYIRVID